MKILCIGYYDKFSRFFLGLKKASPALNIKILSLYFSGYLYSIFRLTPSTLLSFKSWANALVNKKKYLNIINHQNAYKNISFESIIAFHLKLNKNISKRNLLLQAVSYIDLIHAEFTSFKPDAILLIGDSRLSIEITKKIAKSLNIKVYFIELGPFDTTFFDEQGVNANASIRQFEIAKKDQLTPQQQKDIQAFINRPKTIKYKRSPFYRAIDLTIDKLLHNTYFYPPDLKYSDTFPKININKNQREFSFKAHSTTNKFLLILQVPMDVNLVYHSPYFSNHYQMVKNIYKNLPANSKLYLREHPIYRGKYEKKLYDFCDTHNIYFDTCASINKSLNLADVIIVNNSTTGIEAISLKKTVVVLGNAYYDHPKLCIKYTKHDNLNQLLCRALDFTPNEHELNIFLNEFLFNYLIPGFLTDQNLNSAKIIGNKILREHSKHN
ncbi:capsular polysaccharide export protein, LipB/KpsS family [Algibacter pacificus]|uniref:capsular polysaccharide export protein, LipB/KpsS family n=1 Tax=Algibacter pacificus TaxID=2599389 RepID=UPI0011CB96D3|nr:hypothetical protein [Algibacter pacificus]